VWYTIKATHGGYSTFSNRSGDPGTEANRHSEKAYVYDLLGRGSAILAGVLAKPIGGNRFSLRDRPFMYILLYCNTMYIYLTVM
jgi:hypothetical protein